MHSQMYVVWRPCAYGPTSLHPLGRGNAESFFVFSETLSGFPPPPPYKIIVIIIIIFVMASTFNPVLQLSSTDILMLSCCTQLYVHPFCIILSELGLFLDQGSNIYRKPPIYKKHGTFTFPSFQFFTPCLFQRLLESQEDRDSVSPPGRGTLSVTGSVFLCVCFVCCLKSLSISLCTAAHTKHHKTRHARVLCA